MNDSHDFEEKELPLLPIRDLVIYPFMIIPLFIGRKSSIEAVEAASKNPNRLILLSSQKDIAAENPSPNDIYNLGTVAMIMRTRKLPDGRIKILIQGLSKARIINFEKTSPFFIAKIEKITNIEPEKNQIALQALMRNITGKLEKIIDVGKALSPDILTILGDIKDPGKFSDLIASNLNLPLEEAQFILEILDPTERLHKIDYILKRELDILTMQEKIKTNSEKIKTMIFLKNKLKT